MLVGYAAIVERKPDQGLTVEVVLALFHCVARDSGRYPDLDKEAVGIVSRCLCILVHLEHYLRQVIKLRHPVKDAMLLRGEQLGRKATLGVGSALTSDPSNINVSHGIDDRVQVAFRREIQPRLDRVFDEILLVDKVLLVQVVRVQPDVDLVVVGFRRLLLLILGHVRGHRAAYIARDLFDEVAADGGANIETLCAREPVLRRAHNLGKFLGRMVHFIQGLEAQTRLRVDRIVPNGSTRQSCSTISGKQTQIVCSIPHKPYRDSGCLSTVVGFRALGGTSDTRDYRIWTIIHRLLANSRRRRRSWE